MKKKIIIWQLIGFGITSVGGVLLHFLYDASGESLLAAPFSGINESTWEHMKLLFWPAFIYALIESFAFKERNDFWCIKLKGILLALILIPVIFYTYNGVIGKSPDWINISIFFIAVAVSTISEIRKLFRPEKICKPYLALALLLGIAIAFITFTFVTPKIGIFMDPTNHSYGI